MRSFRQSGKGYWHRPTNVPPNDGVPLFYRWQITKIIRYVSPSISTQGTWGGSHYINTCEWRPTYVNRLKKVRDYPDRLLDAPYQGVP